ncbi:MATE family efflux transporter [Butyrivibrio sp. CB08]|uniref:MATE family efflux transporter n=1 Tax=Butyrivibrio sp. CB08 TaxID=2364879 RepID=UPI000EA9FB68|nr:MATE family efflux transporter [Butyrivibrio sp. CB08]RKM59303.1 MATE family efflux transporter [Butyrivibrio sp. CB08]
MSNRQKSAVLNMTEGNTVSLIIKFSIPMLIGNLFQQFYNLVDSVIVGQVVGADALAAIGATGSVTFLFFALCNGIGSGGGIVTSQFFGSGNVRGVKRCVSNTGYIMIIFPTVVGIIAYFLTAPVLELLKTPADIMGDAVAYMKIMCLGLVFVSLYNYASSMLRALGDSKTPLYFLIFSCLLNAALDLLFVCALHMSVVGAGIATVISQLVSGISCLIYAFLKNEYFHLQKDDLKFDMGIFVKVLQLGVPLSLQFSLIAISTMALQRVVNSFGKVAVAAFTATGRIEQIIHQPYQTLGAALATYTGQNYGANKNDRIITGYRKSLMLMAIFTVIMLPVMQYFGGPITSIFVEDVEVIDMGAKALQITSLFYIMLGVIYVVRGVLNGLGDSFFALLNGIVEVIGRFIVPVMLTRIPSIGLWGIWWSVGIVWAISGLTAWMRYVSCKTHIAISQQSV